MAARVGTIDSSSAYPGIDSLDPPAGSRLAATNDSEVGSAR